MSKTAKRAAEYERRYPGTGVSPEQAAERMERLEAREDLQANRRTNRTSGIVVPALPWLRERANP